MRARRMWAAASLVALAAGCAAGNNVRSVTSDADRFTLARAYRERGDCVRAIELLRIYVNSASGSADVDEAVYMLGDCYITTRDYASGEVELERLLREYPESDSAGSAAFRLGEAYWGQAKSADFDQEMTLKALAQWNSYVRQYPEHWENGAAQKRIAQARERLAQKAFKNGLLYLKLKLTEPARVYFQQVLAEYGDTPSAADAALGLALIDIKRMDYTTALTHLQRVESEYPGTPAAKRAAQERAKLERVMRDNDKTARQGS